MKIAICGSLDFTQQMKEIKEELVTLGHEATLPMTAEFILNGKVTLEQIQKEKKDRLIHKRKIKLDVIKYYFRKIREAQAILVVNYTKKGVKNYIGGNTFLEIGFAHVLDKKIYFLNPVPRMSYEQEIMAMKPEIINRNLKKIPGGSL